MVYYFTYEIDHKYYKKICYTMKEALIFFDVLISARACPIRVLSIRKRSGENDKIRYEKA